MKIGLALGGGAARGLAHIGVLKILEEERIPIDIITGCSIGALAGALYAISPHVEKVEKKIGDYLQSSEFKWPKFNLPVNREHDKNAGFFYRFTHFLKKGIFYTSSLTKRSFISEEGLASNINYLIEDILIENTAIPFACTAVDLWTGAEVILKDGSIRKAVSASCAIPGVLAPISFNGSELVDGGVVDCVPIQPAFKMGAHLVIGVDVAHDIEDLQVDTALDIAFRANDISRMTLRKLQLKEANVVIRPEVNDILWSDFSRMDECVNRGMEATRMKILEIKRLIRKKKIKRFFR